MTIVAAAGIAGLLLAGGGCLLNPGEPSDGGQPGRVAAELSAPLRLNPANSAEVSGATLQLVWSPVPGATEYELHLGPDTNPPAIATTEQTTYLVRDLPECTPHYWRVVAIDGDRATSGPVWMFTTTCPDQ